MAQGVEFRADVRVSGSRVPFPFRSGCPAFIVTDMKVTGRRVAIGVAVVGTMVVVWAGIAFEEKLFEQWYLWKLDSGEEEEQELAAEKLGQMKSKRAIPRLVELLRGSAARSGAVCVDGSRIVNVALSDAATGTRLTTWVRSHHSFTALVRVGRPAVSALRHLVEDKDDGTRWAAALALNEIDPQEHVADSVLRAGLEVFDSVTR